jgi:ribosomal protein S18 acetylase RimI-like enzyme
MTEAVPGLHIVEAAIADAARMGGLIDAMDRHYHPDMAERPPARSADAAAGWLARREGTRFRLALLDGVAAGIACYAVVRPGFELTGLIFVKDLYVLPEHRSAGIGEALLADLARLALAEGIGRIDLYTGVDNTGARAFYRRLGGAEEMSVKFRYVGSALGALAARDKQ